MTSIVDQAWLDLNLGSRNLVDTLVSVSIESSLDHQRIDFPATGLRGAALEHEELAVRVHLGWRPVTDNPADVEKMLLRCRAFLEFDADSFPLKLNGVHRGISS